MKNNPTSSSERINTAVFGLAVMGSNLARNIESRGIPVVVYNRTAQVTSEFVKAYPGKKFIPALTLSELIEKTERPRRIIVMIKAGPVLDGVLDELLSKLSPGDIIIDGGNSLYTDTERRVKRCEEHGINFIGCGISGGEEGALKGPSLMPGGKREAWELCRDLFTAIAARVGDEPCTDYVGPGGSGHFVKMVHNGIEYADMQLIAESYQFMKHVLHLDNDAIAERFGIWNTGRLESYLMEISAHILKKRDPETGAHLVDLILDKAGQKGTGRWTVQEGLEQGVPIPTIAAAVDARAMSALKEERVVASELIKKPASAGSPTVQSLIGSREEALSGVENALYLGKVVAYAQGMALIRAASESYQWSLKLDRVAALWRGGCIIRAALLREIMAAFMADRDLKNLLTFPSIRGQIEEGLSGFRAIVGGAAVLGVSLPGLSSALTYLESYTTALLPQNLIQAQRDYFGAHTYERLDKAGVFHTEW